MHACVVLLLTTGRMLPAILLRTVTRGYSFHLTVLTNSFLLTLNAHLYLISYPIEWANRFNRPRSLYYTKHNIPFD
jgi:hypothetical protein